MNKTILLLAVCLLGLSTIVNCTSKPFDYYTYERELPATVCRDVECSTKYMLNYDGKQFSQHGLWPNGSTSDICYHPQSCNKQTYNESLIEKDILDWMNEDFIGLYSSSQSFRSHEFTKHGTCTMQANSLDTENLENYYFGQIKTVNSKYNLYDTFKSEGIVPSDTKTYTYDAMYAALSKGFTGQTDYSINLKCISLNKQQYLAAVQLFLDLDFNLTTDLCKTQKSQNPNALQYLMKKFLAEEKNTKINKVGDGQTFQPCTTTKDIHYPEFDWSSLN